jgi:hypothetical protein
MTSIKKNPDRKNVFNHYCRVYFIQFVSSKLLLYLVNVYGKVKYILFLFYFYFFPIRLSLLFLMADFHEQRTIEEA